MRLTDSTSTTTVLVLFCRTSSRTQSYHDFSSVNFFLTFCITLRPFPKQNYQNKLSSTNTTSPSKVLHKYTAYISYGLSSETPHCPVNACILHRMPRYPHRCTPPFGKGIGTHPSIRKTTTDSHSDHIIYCNKYGAQKSRWLTDISKINPKVRRQREFDQQVHPSSGARVM